MIGDGTIIQAVGVGTIKLQAYNENKWIESSLSNVLYVPKIAVNLFLVGAAVDKGYTLEMDNKSCKFLKNDKVGAMATRQNNIFMMIFKSNPTTGKAYFGSFCGELEEWHFRLTHQNTEHVKNILKRSGINYTGNDEMYTLNKRKTT